MLMKQIWLHHGKGVTNVIRELEIAWRWFHLIGLNVALIGESRGGLSTFVGKSWLIIWGIWSITGAGSLLGQSLGPFMTISWSATGSVKSIFGICILFSSSKIKSVFTTKKKKTCMVFRNSVGSTCPFYYLILNTIITDILQCFNDKTSPKQHFTTLFKPLTYIYETKTY